MGGVKSWTGGALLTAAAILWLTPATFAQITSIPVSTLPQYPNTVGFGVSYGPFLDRDADFWGLAVDYGRRLQDGWSIGAS